jgi:hypothetical protein
MRALLLVEPGPVPPPPEQLPMLLQAFKAWRAKWRNQMETFEFFAGRGGGWGVVNADDKAVAQQMMEFPFTPFSVISIHPTIDGDEALDMLIATVNEMMAQMQSNMPPS